MRKKGESKQETFIGSSFTVNIFESKLYFSQISTIESINKKKSTKQDKHNPVSKMKNQGWGDPNSKQGTKFLPKNRQENEITPLQSELQERRRGNSTAARVRS